MWGTMNVFSFNIPFFFYFKKKGKKKKETVKCQLVRKFSSSFPINFLLNKSDLIAPNGPRGTKEN